jgi:hypothetical protein
MFCISLQLSLSTIMYRFQTITRKAADAVLAARPEVEAGAAASLRTTATVRRVATVRATQGTQGTY